MFSKKFSFFLNFILIINLLPFIGGNGSFVSGSTNTAPIIADHSIANLVRLDQIPDEAIIEAKNKLHIAYQHTSHGSQIITGMADLPSFKEANGGTPGLFSYNSSFLEDNTIASYAPDPGQAADAGYSQWSNATRAFLQDINNKDVNVIMWSWCGQLSWMSEEELVNHYLTPMSILEQEFPDVTFVYMTGHTDGTGLEGNLHQRNEQIREFCKENNKVLYDFADIESYDPDGNYYGDKNVSDDCSWNNGTHSGNWAIEWQNTHEEGVDWYNCGSAHSQPLNANLKAYSAWWLWATLAGWENESNSGTGNNGDETAKTSFLSIYLLLIFFVSISTNVLSNKRKVC
ncbi:MAG: hypothetical protein K9W46_02575 [Candidatus Heimdallarchaeum endolithica]|uniref:Uncharacterized protein n=1 Tax=Candidatus Heimdallarchaeum endolithica TaxID=2876572 RepID=A0A9Y1BTH3_9ARCH|nr:MAG: hypothetical protein K9W46_02575 [Candidatus Heimdallarchaeum endolithica]